MLLVSGHGDQSDDEGFYQNFDHFKHMAIIPLFIV